MNWQKPEQKEEKGQRNPKRTRNSLVKIYPNREVSAGQVDACRGQVSQHRAPVDLDYRDNRGEGDAFDCARGVGERAVDIK